MSALRAHFAIPGDLGTPTGGYVYDAALMAAGGRVGLDLIHLPLPGGFPSPDAAALASAAHTLGAVRGPILIDGLALGALDAAALDAISGPLIALVHHPLGLEPGLTEQRAAELVVSEGRALAKAARVITTSAETARDVASLFHIPMERISVAPPGVRRGPAANPSSGDPVILAVGSIIHRKGHDVLIRALDRIRDRRWLATFIGSRELEPDHARRIEAMIADLGLDGRIGLLGAQSAGALDAFYQAASIFCLPSRYEGYGMVFDEAMARGLPVVAARAGAVPDVVPNSAGILVAPEDDAALADALASLIDDPAARFRLAEGAARHGAALPDWTGAARIVREAIAAAVARPA